ncbi:MAG: pantoate--beta-alanine ligase [Saprospiraceae bacterium]|nr:pantoate--beta-alanine ligase [Saprospiraceae bacterium]
MITFSTVDSLSKRLNKIKGSQQSIALVPTMGALHEGHISLILTALEVANKVCASIFVNPTQFNNPDDLAKYPRTFQKDKEMLDQAGCNYLFAPTVEEVYPNGTQSVVNLKLKGMDKIMEGHFRPGHFKGMLQVVKRLLDIVQPDFLIMGQKDYQQFTLVNQMILQLNIPTKLIVVQTMREPDGLAMSSRNRRLSTPMRRKSAILFKALNYARLNLALMSITSLEKECSKLIDSVGLKTEYFSIVDALNLTSISKYRSDQKLVACVAAWADDVRLIDNLILN